MRRKQTTAWLYGYCWLSAAVGCGVVGNEPQVDFGESRQLGLWESGTAQTVFETEGLPAEPDTAAAGGPAVAAPSGTATGTGMGTSSMNTVQAPSGAAGGSAPSAGHAAPTPPAASGGSTAASAAGSGAEPAAMPELAEPTAVTSVQLSYTTEVLGGRYRPKNIGAVWVADSSGKLVKSLEVWARLRLRYLNKYAEARAGARPDVTATATLTSHKAHTASWDLKDKAGASVMPGMYTLHVEITDADAPGKHVMIPFDLSAGTTLIAPPDSTGFVGMQLELK
jgi:hypothetical protein